MSTLSDPLEDLEEVTKSDATDNAIGARAIYLPVSGTVKVTTHAGNQRTIPLTAGYHPMRVRRVWSTGTTSGLSVWVGR